MRIDWRWIVFHTIRLPALVTAVFLPICLSVTYSREGSSEGKEGWQSPGGGIARNHGHGIESGGSVSAWVKSIGRDIERREYQPCLSGSVLQAPNRAHHLRIEFRETGIRVYDRSADPRNPDWAWEWQTSRWGREERLAAVRPVSPQVEADRAWYRRGDLDEWYENRPEGLEQGFVIRKRPPGESWICIEGHLRGATNAMRPDGSAVDVWAADQHALSYGHLKVVDAHGHLLMSRLDLEADRMRILINDSGAAYPILVDPVLQSPSWTTQIGSPGANWGFSVATAGDVNGDDISDVVVGVPYYDGGQLDEGAIFIYLGSPSGLSTTPATTAIQIDFAGASFGFCVAPAGDVNLDGYDDVIVGAPTYTNGQTNEGAAFIFKGISTGLDPTAAWMRQGSNVGVQYGWSVAMAGDVNGDRYRDVLVGAPFWNGGQTNEGAAFLYLGASNFPRTSGEDWFAESNIANARYGHCVATAGGVNDDGFHDFIIGAPGYANDDGAAYIYTGSAGPPFAAYHQTLTSPTGADQLGFSVATAGDVNGDGYADVVIGAPYHSISELDFRGRAYVYHGSATGVDLTADWVFGATDFDAQFGYSVAPAGDVNGDGFADVIVGAQGSAVGYPSGSGTAYVFEGSHSGLATTPVWSVHGTLANEHLGRCVATAGDIDEDGFGDVVVGSPGYNAGGGRTQVFRGRGAVPTAAAFWTQYGAVGGAHLGSSLATAGDVNNDGFSDVLVGAPHLGGGRVYLHLGSATPAPGAAWVKNGTIGGEEFGGSVAMAGDVNRDGYSDILIGARGYNAARGRADLFLGSASGPATNPVWTDTGSASGDYFGHSVASAGDVNGDGYSDIIVGAPYWNGTFTDEGRVLVYLGSAAGISSSPPWTASGNQASSNFGWEAASAGDVNDDGYADVVIGSYSFSNGQATEGRVLIYLGSPTGLASMPAWTIEGDADFATFGSAVASAGDVNGDGYSDIIVGAYNYSGGTGAAFVFHGPPPPGPVTVPDWSYQIPSATGAELGSSVSRAGDVNNDGYGDVIVGAPFFNGVGKAFLFLGSADGLTTSPDWSVVGVQAQGLGVDVAFAGDANGDGFSDVLVGSPYRTNSLSEEGAAGLYLGNGGNGRARVPRYLGQTAAVGKGGSSRSIAGVTTHYGLTLLSPTGKDWRWMKAATSFFPTIAPGCTTRSCFPGGAKGQTLSGDDDGTAERTVDIDLMQGFAYSWVSWLETDSPFFPHSVLFKSSSTDRMEKSIRTPALETSFDVDATTRTIESSRLFISFDTTSPELVDILAFKDFAIGGMTAKDLVVPPFEFYGQTLRGLSASQGFISSTPNSQSWQVLGQSDDHLFLRINSSKSGEPPVQTDYTFFAGETYYLVNRLIRFSQSPQTTSFQVYVPRLSPRTAFSMARYRNSGGGVVTEPFSGCESGCVRSWNGTWAQNIHSSGMSVTMLYAPDNPATNTLAIDQDGFTVSSWTSPFIPSQTFSTDRRFRIIMYFSKAALSVASLDSLYANLWPIVTDTEIANVPETKPYLALVSRPGARPLRIRYAIPARGPAKLEIFNVRGALIANLLDGVQEPGVRQLLWDGRSRMGRLVASGIYFMRLETIRGPATARAVVMH